MAADAKCKCEVVLVINDIVVAPTEDYCVRFKRSTSGPAEVQLTRNDEPVTDSWRLSLFADSSGH